MHKGASLLEVVGRNDWVEGYVAAAGGKWSRKMGKPSARSSLESPLARRSFEMEQTAIASVVLGRVSNAERWYTLDIKQVRRLEATPPQPICDFYTMDANADFQRGCWGRFLRGQRPLERYLAILRRFGIERGQEMGAPSDIANNDRVNDEAAAPASIPLDAVTALRSIGASFRQIGISLAAIVTVPCRHVAAAGRSVFASLVPPSPPSVLDISRGKH
ncbi:hypothetical protein F503_03989 [Ophiostoma piceae UAMH 11346]|uniref:Uncharacterized protein n=1 Tax=Ophiostoma piceae (strain UAMH 11346) TaxID=1262450 RepID=S3CPX4_OPHP1|nr:hypothetical protein F503_03989 [Ophiostoma piceae UAMH 11346]